MRPRSTRAHASGRVRGVLMNLDAGERDDEPEALWALFDVLAIACGGHAGDRTSMARVVGFCARDAIRVAAHPSYPDREGFGRRSIAMSPDAVAASIAEQCARLAAIAREAGVTVEAVKPHGALYHDARRDPVLAAAVVRGAIDALGTSLAMIGPPTGALREAALAHGLRYAREGFADRALRPDGTLVPRDQPGALILEPAAAAAHAVAIAREVDTICVHADTPNALAIAHAVREALRG
jgi:5-oxoprolinase (ATP-hydrolysing) subunit A